MILLNKTDEDILKIATPMWDNLVKCSNNKDYSGFTKDFSAQMLYGANEVELGKQWSNNELLLSNSSTLATYKHGLTVINCKSLK